MLQQNDPYDISTYQEPPHIKIGGKALNNVGLSGIGTVQSPLNNRSDVHEFINNQKRI